MFQLLRTFINTFDYFASLQNLLSVAVEETVSLHRVHIFFENLVNFCLEGLLVFLIFLHGIEQNLVCIRCAIFT